MNSKYIVTDGPDKELIEDLLAAAENIDLKPKSLQQRLYQAADRLHELAHPVAQTGVPEGWSIRPETGAYIVCAPNNRGAYAAQPTLNNIAATVLYELAKDLLAAAPTPSKEEE